MTSVVDTQVAQAMRKAAVRATYAPSVHNTQPWRLLLTPDGLELFADWTRKLSVLDPTGRQLLISCGSALFNARVALEHAGYDTIVRRHPDPADPTLLARLIATGPAETTSELGVLDAVVQLRQTNRRRFADDPVDEQLIATLIAAAATEGTQLIEIRRMEQRLAIARLSQEADREQNSDPAYRAELRAWTTVDPARRDGVPALTVPHVAADTHDDIPIRDFDTTGSGYLPVATDSSVRQCLLLLATPEDTPEAWLRAGEALERVWLEAVRHGYAISLFTQLIEIPRTRETLRRELQMTGQPQVLIRVGRAPTTPASRRRRLVDVLTETS
jgi:hypothetical protein